MKSSLWPYGKQSLILALILSIFTMPVHAQTSGPRFARLTTEHGLSHNSVSCILQDHQGFMWFGTQDGLNRYDGYTFTVYRHRRSDPFSLSGNTINVLYEDRAGTLWIGTVAGLDSSDGVEGHFIHHAAIPQESIGAIYEDPSGDLWIGTIGQGLFRYTPQTGQVVHYRHMPSDPYSLSDNNVLAIHQDRAGTLWVGTMYGGLNALERATGHFTRYAHNPTDASSLGEGQVTAIYQDRRGTLWVATGVPNERTKGGLNVFNPVSGQFIHYRHDPSDPHSLGHNNVHTIYEDQSGILWIGTEGGLDIFDPLAGRFTHYRYDPLDSRSLSHNNVTTIYESRDGVLWFGTDGGGISQYARHKDRFVRYFHDPLTSNSLGESAVGALVEDHSGNLWIGLHNGGLDRLDRRTGQFTHYRHDPNNPHSLSHNHVTALCVDSEGVLWIGTSAALDRFDPTTGQFSHYAHNPDDPYSLGPGGIKVIIEGRNHALWIGTEDPGTLSRFDRSAGTFVRYEADPANSNGFIPTYGVRAIYEDEAGALWLGTYNGLVRFEQRSGTFTPYRHDDADPYSLSDDFVWAITAGQGGVLWIGTHRGLNRFDRSSGRFTVYTVEDGLPNDAIVAILPDNEGNLWLATMGGDLSRFNPQTGVFRHYNAGDGLQGGHFIIGAAYRSPGGEMFFGGSNGFNAFYPTEIKDNAHIPPIVLTAFRKFDQVMEFKTPLVAVREITLTYKDNFFAFEFAALDYTDPARNQYAYQLEGFDRDWIACGSRRYASYTNLPPGKYTFRVKGSNNDGIWNEAGLAVQIIITPPFWATWWFRGLLVAVIGGVLGLTYRVRAQNIAALREREERFRALFENAPLGVFEVDISAFPPRILRANRESARIYGRTVEELESMSPAQLVALEPQADLERLLKKPPVGQTITLESVHRRQDGSEFPVRVSAALQRATRRGQTAILIVEDITAEKAWRSEEEAIAEERRRIAREIHDGLAQDLAALRLRVRLWHRLVDESPQQMHAELDALRNLLSTNIREVRRAIFALRPVALDELGFYPALRQFTGDFGEQNQLHVNLHLTGEAVHLPASLEPMLFRLIQEALHNVAKHAQATTVWIEFKLDEEALHLVIRDDGVGFDPAILEQAVRRGHVGLKQMQERVARLKGTFALHTAPGKGTEIRVVLPLEGRTPQAPRPEND